MVTIYFYPKVKGFLADALFAGNQTIKAARNQGTPSHLISQCASPIWLYHINQTFTSNFPVFRAELNSLLCQSGIVVWNGQSTDISKRNIQKMCAEIGWASLAAEKYGDPDELLIVKSNLNYGGRNEKNYWRALSKNIIKPPKIIKSCHDYEVIERKQIPAYWFESEHLHIEKYISNSENIIFRAFYLLGRMTVTKKFNPHKVKKIEGDLMRWNYSDKDAQIFDIAAKVTLLARKMNTEFCSMDILLNDTGTLYICDVNTTPFWSGCHDDKNCQTPDFTDTDMLDYLRMVVPRRT